MDKIKSSHMSCLLFLPFRSLFLASHFFSFFFLSFFLFGVGGAVVSFLSCSFLFLFFSILSSFPPSPALSLLTFLLTCCAIRVGVVGDPGTTAVTGALTSARLAEVEVAR